MHVWEPCPVLGCYWVISYIFLNQKSGLRWGGDWIWDLWSLRYESLFANHYAIYPYLWVFSLPTFLGQICQPLLILFLLDFCITRIGKYFVQLSWCLLFDFKANFLLGLLLHFFKLLDREGVLPHVCWSQVILFLSFEQFARYLCSVPSLGAEQHPTSSCLVTRT